MTRFVFVVSTILALILVWTGCRLVLSQSSPSTTCTAPPVSASGPCGHCGHCAQTCKVYALADLGDDPSLGPWLAETIPAVIEPQTWKHDEEKCTLRYYAARRMLVVYHTADVQKKVQAFLEEVKKNPPQGEAFASKQTKAGAASAVLPARFLTAAAASDGNTALPYPVPPPVQQPKHLFHFIIRYEGQGIVDDNIVKAMQIYGKKVDADADKPGDASEKKNKDDDDKKPAE
jgi:hypothetical protein